MTQRRQDDEFEAEVAAHLDLLTEEGIRRGATPEDARRQAILRFGGPVQIKEQQHDNRSLPFVETTLRDIRYGVRALRRSPAYSLVAIATLAIGIGAGTAVFSVVGAVLMRPLPYQAPDQLVRIYETNPLRRWTRNIAAPANYADWRTRNKSFTDIAAYEQFNTTGSGAGDVFLTGFGEPQGLKSLGVSGNLFQVLGGSAAPGTHLCRRGTVGGPFARRDPELRPLAVRLRRRSGHRRQDDHAERPRLRRRRGDAADVLLSGARRAALDAVRLHASS